MAKGEKFHAMQKIETDLIFKHKDAYMARFAMDNPKGLLSKRVIEIDPAGVFPTDFDIQKYGVSGKITISVEVTEK